MTKPCATNITYQEVLELAHPEVRNDSKKKKKSPFDTISTGREIVMSEYL